MAGGADCRSRGREGRTSVPPQREEERRFDSLSLFKTRKQDTQFAQCVPYRAGTVREGE